MTEHQEMRRVRCHGESAGAHEEGPHEVRGGRLPALSVVNANRSKAVDVQGLLLCVVKLTSY